MEFGVLGPLGIVKDGRNFVPTAPKPRQVASLLMLRRNSIVQISELIDELWEDSPPNSAMTTLQTYIYKLRRSLAECGAQQALATRPCGYLLTVPDQAFDLHRFEARAAAGRKALEQGDPDGAARTLRQALDEWRGPALVDVTPGKLLSAYATRLEELRLRARELRIEADLALGRHRELVSELKSLALTHPLDEQLHAALMTALHRSSRRYEALEVYQTLRANMVEELGLEPGRSLRELQQSLLAEPAAPTTGSELTGTLERRAVVVAAPTEAPAAPAPTTPSWTPAQLPPDVRDFTGREEILAGAVAHLTLPAEAAAARTVVIGGMPGTGKTALAIRLGHQVRSDFPDGQLYAELRASTRHPRPVSDVLAMFLRSLGIAATHLPDSTEERASLLRSLTAGRRLLFVLDDVARTDLRHLLPGEPQCGVVVASRRRVHSLPGAHRVGLDVLERSDAVQLLTHMAGTERVRHAPQAAAALVDLAAGRLPLAVRGIGARLASSPGVSVAAMVDHLSRSPRIFEQLRTGDLDVQAALDSAYEGFSRDEQASLRLLSMLPSTEFTAETAAELLGWDVTVVETVLTSLVDSYFLRVQTGDGGRLCYTFPNPVLIYAEEHVRHALSRDRQARTRQPAGRHLHPRVPPAA